MSKDQDKLAAELQNMRPSSSSRKKGMAAALSAFDKEFVANDVHATDMVATGAQSENNSAATQGSSPAPRLTGQSIGEGPAPTFGSRIMSKLKPIFTFNPKMAMMAGSCMAALVAAIVVMPQMDDLTNNETVNVVISDMPEGLERADDIEVVTEPSPVSEVETLPTVTASEIKTSIETPVGEIVPADKVAPKAVVTPQAVAELTPPVKNTNEVGAVKEKLSNIVVIERRVVKTPSSVQERLVPSVTKTETRRVLKTPEKVEWKEVTEGDVNIDSAAGGKRYRRVIVPAEYDIVQEAVVVQEASTELVTIPATYETVTETIKVNADGSTEVLSTSAVTSPSSTSSTSGNDKIIVTAGRRVASDAIVPVPAPVVEVPSNVQNQQPSFNVTPSRLSTRASTFNHDQLSAPVTSAPSAVYADKRTNSTLTSEQNPVEYKTITRRVVKTPTTTIERVVPAITKDVTVQVELELSLIHI